MNRPPADRPSHSSPVAAPRAPDRLADSPWFWLALFGAVALISLLGIQGKYAQRQARLEQRYRDRLLTQDSQAAGPPPPVASDLQPGYEDEPLEPEGVSMAAARARTSLISLQVLAGGALLAGLVGLQYQRQQRLRAPATAAGKSHGEIG